jgi:hypothetical protein
MMKKIIVAIGLMFGGVAFVNAQQTQQDTTQTQTQQSDQYRSDTTSTDDSQNQTQTQSDDNTTDSNTTEQSDAYRTDSTSTTGTESTTTMPPTTDDQSSSTTSDQTGVSQDDQEQEGEKIEVSELPAAVSTKLQGTDYQGWVVVSARKKMWKDPADSQAIEKEVYVIEAKNGAETKKLKFDKDGNEIEQDENKKDDQK